MITKIIITFIVVSVMAGLIYLVWFRFPSTALTIKDCVFSFDPNADPNKYGIKLR